MSDSEIDALYHAIELKDWDTVRGVLRIKNCRGKIEHFGNSTKKENALHLACRDIQTIPKDVLQSLFSISPDLLLSQSSEGRTPLHYALSSIAFSRLPQHEESILHESVFLLIDSCPQATIIADDNDFTPLHYAIDLDLSVEIIRRLLAAGPSAIKHCDYRGYTPLTTFFEYWNIGIRKTISSCESQGGLLPNSPVRHFYNMDNRQLHEVYDCLMQLIFAENEENYSKTSFNAARLALENVQCPWSICYIILKAQPAIAFQHDENGDYLLHLATTSISTLDGDLYECTICKKQLSVLSRWGIDPIDWHRYCHDCVQEDTDEDELSFISYEGELLPSFIYIKSVDKIPPITKDLIKLNSAVANLPNHNGRLPLHLAIEHNASLLDGHIKMIFEAAPDSLCTRDISSHMYPFMIAAVKSTQDMKRRGGMSLSEIMRDKFQLCYDLLIQNPTLVQVVERMAWYELKWKL